MCVCGVCVCVIMCFYVCIYVCVVYCDVCVYLCIYMSVLRGSEYECEFGSVSFGVREVFGVGGFGGGFFLILYISNRFGFGRRMCWS